MPRTRPSSHQLRWVKKNMNYFDDTIKKDERDTERHKKNRSCNISPTDWKKSIRRATQSVSRTSSPIKNDSPLKQGELIQDAKKNE